MAKKEKKQFMCPYCKGRKAIKLVEETTLTKYYRVGSKWYSQGAMLLDEVVSFECAHPECGEIVTDEEGNHHLTWEFK
jgi:predicted RNA-binding Zn-ribbon protein involved in translation (DUF1610 family)